MNALAAALAQYRDAGALLLESAVAAAEDGYSHWADELAAFGLIVARAAEAEKNNPVPPAIRACGICGGVQRCLIAAHLSVPA